ncbi:hypothetical protein N0V94_009034 [Neodidymelliopsis sp. IMI 364377]|nr:hypothetical protein N0V94_009034 [Neodidymelliopsis sp. IMI 364377]
MLTQQQDPPEILITEGLDHWTDIAEDYLSAVRSSRYSTFNNTDICYDEPATVPIANEASVRRISELFIVDPLNRAINYKYREDIIMSSEITKQRLRYDSSFNVNGTKPVMIIEYKRPGLVFAYEFRKGMVNPAKKDEHLRKMRNNPFEQCSITPSSDAYNLLKQATVYSQNWGCPYVALCDYDNLVLLNFNNELESARATVVPRKSIRKALLGFLIEAYDHAELTDVRQ